MASINAQTDVFTSEKFVKNVQNFGCDRRFAMDYVQNSVSWLGMLIPGQTGF